MGREVLKQLWKTKDGAVAIIAAFAIPVVLVFVGMAIDIARVNYVNSKLAYAADAAVVAALRYDQANAIANATKVFNANFPANFLGANVTPQVTVAEDFSEATVKASGQVKGYFSSFVGITNLSVGATATSRRGSSGLELAMVLDVTGSMDWSGKMPALKQAATNMINIIYGNNNSRNNTVVSIVPFVATVNIGTAHTAWLSNPAIIATFPSGQPWKGCVMASPNEETVLPPGSNLWPVYYTQSTIPMHLTTPNATWDNDWRTGVSGNVVIVHPMFDGSNGAQPVSIGPNRSCGPPILPTSNDKTALLNSISGFSPIYGGGTFGNLGFGWGWRMLDPGWGPYLPVAPKPYNQTNNKKVLLFMTDGFNQWYDSSPSPTGDPTAYGFQLTGNTLGISSIGASRAAIDNKFLSLCAQAKAKGIEVYTLLFMGGDAQAVNMLTTCASRPSNFFNATTTTEIVTYFQDIANQINTVTIVK